MQINIKRKNKNAKLPTQAYEGDAGWDLYAVDKRVVDEGDFGYIEYGTGWAFEIPEGHVGLLYPRSSISKTGMILANSVGVCDSLFRGEVTFRFKPIPNTKHYDIGDKIGQMIVMPYPKVTFQEVDELSQSERNENGYGSSGSK